MNRFSSSSYKTCVSLVVMLLVSVGCSKQADYAHSERYVESSAEYVEDSLSKTAASGVSENTVVSKALDNTTHITADGKTRQLVKTAQARFDVKDVYTAAMTIEDMTANVGGFVTQNTIENHLTNEYSRRTSRDAMTIVEAYRPTAQLRVRIPSDKVQPFLRELMTHVAFMYGRNFEAKDVLLSIIKQQQLAKVNAAAARNVGDAAQSNDELIDKVSAIDHKVMYQQSKILAEIEQADLRDRVAFSTIDLQLTQPTFVRKKTEQSFAAVVDQIKPDLSYRLQESMYRGWDNFLSFIVGMVGLWPFFILFVVLYAMWRWFRGWKKRRNLKKKTK